MTLQAEPRRKKLTIKIQQVKSLKLYSIKVQSHAARATTGIYSFVKRNNRHLFPDLCCRPRFNRTRRNLLQVTELLRQKITFVFPVPDSRYFVIDSFPLPVCKFGHACCCRSFCEDGANYGKCLSKKETCFGFKVHALTTLKGYIMAFGITPASVDDREGLRDFAENHSGLVMFGDKTNWPGKIRQLIFRFQRRVETVFYRISEQMNAEKVPAKSFWGLCTRLQNKIL